MIKDVHINRITMHFDKPFKIAYEEVDSTEVIIVKIVDDQGLSGLGCISPYYEITGENLTEIHSLIKAQITPDYFDFSFSDWYKYHLKLQADFAKFPSVQAGLEEAVLNLFCLQNKITLKNLFGGYRDQVDTIMSIGIDNATDTIRLVKEKMIDGFKIIKFKCGIDLEDDIKKMSDILKHIEGGIKITFDANGGYNPDQAIKFINSMNDSRIVLFEQPVKGEDINGLRQVKINSKIPVVADESVLNLKQAVNLLSNDYVDGINIKLAKCGGPLNFIKIFNIAKFYNKLMMIGCNYDSNISITTGAALALALPLDYVDLDSGHLDFYDDPASGGAKVVDGQIFIDKPLELIKI